jgi:hypothetical protein
MDCEIDQCAKAIAAAALKGDYDRILSLWRKMECEGTIDDVRNLHENRKHCVVPSIIVMAAMARSEMDRALARASN